MADTQPFDRLPTVRVVPRRRTLDLSTVLGLALTFVLISIGIYIGQSDANFFNLPSFLIVVLGTITVTSISFSTEEMMSAGKVINNSLFRTKTNPQATARQLIDLAVIAKQKGFLALSQQSTELRKDPELFNAVQVVTDGYKPNEVEAVLAQHLDASSERHRRSANILRRASEVAPAMGLIGTLIGLVQMLANLEDPASIGPAMAVALLTTFYGAILGTAVFAPMAAKLERNSNEEAMIRTLTLLAMISIAREDNPRRLEMLLNSELPPSQRLTYFD